MRAIRTRTHDPHRRKAAGVARVKFSVKFQSYLADSNTICPSSQIQVHKGPTT